MNEKVERIRKSVNWGGRATHLNLLMVMALVLSLLMPLAAPNMLAQAGHDKDNVDPNLLQLARDHRDDVFKVIIQREVKNEDLPDKEPEQEVADGGGQVKKQLKMIESFLPN